MSKKNFLAPRHDQYVHHPCPDCGKNVPCMIWDDPELKCNACILKEVQEITNHPMNDETHIR